jgi:phosphoadenosine phosphosulfate reductase
VLVENTMFGERDKVKIAIDRLRSFEPEEGYYLCFSGGKDSQCIYHLAEEAGVKFDAHYNITGIDHPELVYFIRENYPNVERHMYKRSMFRLIEDKGVPTRLKRFCCSELKEHGGEGRICVTGVRWAESNKQKANRKPFEIMTSKVEDKKLFNDNDEERMMFETCMQKGKRIVNPIVDWDDEDVWEYIESRGIKYCKLYDEGYDRLGCIGCPLASNQAIELERNPKFYDNYLKAIGRFVPKYLERCRKKGRKPFLDNAKDWMEWWVYKSVNGKPIQGQEDYFDEID